MPRMNFSTENLRQVFAEEGKYDHFRQLCSSLVRGEDVYELDDQGNERKVSKSDANRAVRKVLMEVCGITEADMNSKKARKRKEEAHKNEIFEIIEEDVDFKINEGFEESEWFNQFVDMKNVKLGDANEFETPDKSVLVVAEIAGDHHDITMQQLGEGERFPVKTSSYGIKIGKDIDLIILGRVDYTKLVDKITEAFVQFVQNMMYTETYNASSKLPSGSGLIGSGTLGASTKAKFDAIIEKVGALNNSEVVIMGTKNALKKLNDLSDVDWRADSQKEAVANSGRLGSYEGTELFEIPQRVKIGDINSYLFDNDVLLIMPVIEDKFVKFVDEGETEIFEVTDKAQLVDDFQTYEVKRTMGIAVVLGQYFGRWNL